MVNPRDVAGNAEEEEKEIRNGKIVHSLSDSCSNLFLELEKKIIWSKLWLFDPKTDGIFNSICIYNVCTYTASKVVKPSQKQVKHMFHGRYQRQDTRKFMRASFCAAYLYETLYSAPLAKTSLPCVYETVVVCRLPVIRHRLVKFIDADNDGFSLHTTSPPSHLLPYPPALLLPSPLPSRQVGQ